jgi:hypothetical protein
VVNVVEIGADFGAEPALSDGVVGVGVEVDSTAVLIDFGDDAAGVGAIMGACAANSFH